MHKTLYGIFKWNRTAGDYSKILSIMIDIFGNILIYMLKSLIIVSCFFALKISLSTLFECVHLILMKSFCCMDFQAENRQCVALCLPSVANLKS